jgi:hypothetical protein
MSTKILLTLLLTGFFAGCSKNEYNTKPTIKIVSVSTKVVDINETLTFDIKVTDKEGDVTDSLYFRKVRLNKRVRPTLRDSFALKIPDAPKATDGTVRVQLDYQNYLVSAISAIENDTVVFKFALKDEAKNISDTATSDQIVIIRQ